MSEVPPPGGMQLVLDAAAIARQPREPMHPGVTYTILWRQDRQAAGLMWIEPDATVPEHTHASAEHHIWLVEGGAVVDGHTVGPGSYWHVPTGVPHSVVGATPDGATLFYLYLRR